MLKQNRNICCKNRLTFLAIIAVVVSLSVFGILVRVSNFSTLNIHSPISISPYLRDYALFSRPVIIDGKQFKYRGDINYTSRLISPDALGMVRLLSRSLKLFHPSLSGASSINGYTYFSWLPHANKLIDLPPPATSFMNPYLWLKVKTGVKEV